MKKIHLLLLTVIMPLASKASEADLKIPIEIHKFGILHWGFLIAILGIFFGIYQFIKVKRLPAHKNMLDIAKVIYKTCLTYLKQQGKFLATLFIFIGIAVAGYFGFLAKGENGESFGIGAVLLILLWTIIGIAGSYTVAAYGIRMNTYANSRMAFASLKRNPLKLLNIPLSAGMSIGVVLICVELILMLVILLLMPAHLAGACFIGFAIGESLGASALRIAGGIFTKIADIGSDLMKVVFKIGEDDPRNPGVIADCTGDNAGDSIGPTADGFETYGVTGVALVSFILLSISDVNIQYELLVWIFSMRILGIITSIVSYYINKGLSKMLYKDKDDMDFEAPLSNLVWITSLLSILGTFILSYILIGGLHGNTDLWWILSTIISCGTLGAALIPEITKIFTSPKSLHVKEVVKAANEGGSSLNILSGFVAGNFSAFWTGLVFVFLMFTAYLFSLSDALTSLGMNYVPIFAFGLVAFGMLGMGPVTIAVDSYGPVTDNAQSVYELSLIEEEKDIDEKIEKDFGFKPDWEKAKYYLEANDGAGNTFKATAKPVLIGTAVVGATTMIFSLILMIEKTLGIAPGNLLNLLNPYTILGFILGGCVIYWFTGASTQAVTTGAYRAVEYIKKNINLDTNAPKKADEKSSIEVVSICTHYAQKGMFNIFIAIFFFALGIACLSSPSSIGGENAVSLFISYLVSIALFGLFQAVFLANAGGSWDNAKKIVEVDMKAKGTPLHDASVVGDTVGDPFKDTSSVALNPIIKFTTLFGLLAMEIAISEAFRNIAPYIGIVFFIIACYFVYRSFYKMRIDQ
ncbi:MAG TPA: sodium-translocating pyrophosphatase [Candidatus Onthomorpha intestinigallinarum]|uniref:K(+)-insensitive pyrophosphate-energized proton pump n=1 Tax=Candidatus Onthomorpha intestinigallinarum TaxID=2840880 RepID=A0A9D1REE6_9BACT|nr:sodium-translocating pyrophosphatase [Candidatus Onthomorpha intestinigallinarum]